MEKVPGLGDIPIIGNLFKYQTRKKTKTNLMVFLRPTVIRNSQQSVSVVTDRYDYIRGAQINAQPEHSAVLPDSVGGVLPPLIDGQPTGGSLLKLTQSMNLGAQKSVTQEPEAATPAR